MYIEEKDYESIIIEYRDGKFFSREFEEVGFNKAVNKKEILEKINENGKFGKMKKQERLILSI